MIISSMALASVFWLQAQTIAPAELRQALQSQEVQLTTQWLQQADDQQFMAQLHSQLEQQRSPIAREWLLQQAIQRLQTMQPSSEAKHFLQPLTEYQSAYALSQDFEGRQRAVPMTHIASQARLTLQWYAVQERAAQLPKTTSLEQLSAEWPQLNTVDQRAWQYRVEHEQHHPSWQLNPSSRALLTEQAPNLAMAIAKRHQDTELVADLLQRSADADLVRFAQTLDEWLPAQTLLNLSKLLSEKNIHRTALYAQLARSGDVNALQFIQQKSLAGDDGALYALVQAQPQQVKNLLQKWFASGDAGQQKRAVFGMRLFNTSDSEHTLKQWAKQQGLATSVQKELAPWQ